MPTQEQIDAFNAAEGKHPGDPGYDGQFDINDDGEIDALDRALLYGGALDEPFTQEVEEFSGYCTQISDHMRQMPGEGSPFDQGSDGSIGPDDIAWFLTHYGTERARLSHFGEAFGTTVDQWSSNRIYDFDGDGVIGPADYAAFMAILGIANPGPGPIWTNWGMVPQDAGVAPYNGTWESLTAIVPGLPITPPMGSEIFVVPETGMVYVVPPSGDGVYVWHPSSVPPTRWVSKEWFDVYIRPFIKPRAPIGIAPDPLPPKPATPPSAGRIWGTALGRLLFWAAVGQLISEGVDEIASAVERCQTFTARMVSQYFELKAGLQATLDALVGLMTRLAAIGGSPGCVRWRDAAVIRLSAAITEVQRRKDEAHAKWLQYQQHDCGVLGWSVEFRDAALANMQKSVDLYNDAAENYNGWLAVIEEKETECGG
jgi:hypothetical protein